MARGIQVWPSPAQDPELISDFIVESREHLANVETQVLTLEREPTNSESLNAVFRGFHTIKGLAGFLELWEVQKLAHEVETVLDRARNSQWTVTGTMKNGERVEARGCDFYSFRGDKVVKKDSFWKIRQS